MKDHRHYVIFFSQNAPVLLLVTQR